MQSPQLFRALWLLLILFPVSAHAHKPSDSYLLIQGSLDLPVLRWDIALRDLEPILAVDSNGDRKITWGELKQSRAQIYGYALDHLRVSRGDQACQALPRGLAVEQHSDGRYAVLLIGLDCPQTSGDLKLRYTLFADIDPSHRGIVLDQRSGRTAGPFVLGPEQNQLALGSLPRPRTALFFDYVIEGVWHIWIGLDHILFIVVLLLPAVLLFKDSQWKPVEQFSESLLSLTKIVTAFTLAHSLTLSISVMGWVNPASRLIESGIALSIILAAWNNLQPRFTRTRWKLAFGFGLLHGFGFAAVLADLGLASEALVLSLFGFNLGVELGQLAILLVLFPLVFLLRHSPCYPTWILQRGSLAAGSVAFAWLIERGFNLDFGKDQFSLLSLLAFLAMMGFFRTPSQQPKTLWRHSFNPMKRTSSLKPNNG